MNTITSIAITNIAASPGDGYVRFAKICAPAYLWCIRSDGPPLTSIKITHGNSQTDDLREYNEIQTNFGITIWTSTTVGISPIIDLKVTRGQADPGFILIEQVTKKLSTLSPSHLSLCFTSLLPLFFLSLPFFSLPPLSIDALCFLDTKNGLPRGCGPQLKYIYLSDTHTHTHNYPSFVLLCIFVSFVFWIV